jgi:vacuolar-type H+-ATPase subunit E/Vma4
MESHLTVSEYKLEEKNLAIIGGVFLRTHDGVIVCDNTLDSRVRLLFEQLLPTIRNTLFPKQTGTAEKSLI